jgi:hypothetical protein
MFPEKSIRHSLYITLSILWLSMLAGCSMPGADLLNKIPINSVEVQVLDQQGNAIPGAQVEASNGRKSSTDADGKAKLRFGTLGVHSISVYADHYMPNNMVITMPADNGKTLTARLTNEVQIGSISFGAMSASLYPMMFNYMFTGYGYELEVEDYAAGDWTEWQVTDEDGEVGTIMKKGLLKELDNGQQWWQIVMFDKGEDEPAYIAEVLFSEGRKRIVRLREKIGDEDPQEKPVSEGWYSQPQQLTKESIEGAVAKRNVSVTVPKGTFKADLIDFGVAPDISLKLWRATAKNVPGGVVKTSTMDGDEVLSSLELTGYGSDARTVLDSF